MVKSVYYIDTKNKTKQHQHHGQIVVSSESSVQLGNIEFAVTSEVTLWNSFERIDHHKGRLLFRDFSDIVVIFTVFLLFGNIMLITSVFGKVVPSPEDLIFLSVTFCFSHHSFLNLSKALKVIKGEFREMNKV